MAPAGVELEMLVSVPDALTTRPLPCAKCCRLLVLSIIDSRLQTVM